MSLFIRHNIKLGDVCCVCLTHVKDWRQHAGSPSVGVAATARVDESVRGSRRAWERDVNAQWQVGLSTAAAGWQIVSVAEAAYTTTALHFPGLPSAS